MAIGQGQCRRWTVRIMAGFYYFEQMAGTERRVPVTVCSTLQQPMGPTHANTQRIHFSGVYFVEEDCYFLLEFFNKPLEIIGTYFYSGVLKFRDHIPVLPNLSPSFIINVRKCYVSAN